ncbi:hypothetical protein BZM27_14505 [Paraburkholderia steynii]|uniref:Uncharacterized protein n=1 Tax=Paraburkholderia steynii TaxID=1245441 RepID=A0A4R0XCJ5_9BURK|nr:hypothetical protein BZM27_14505 [Paraburkholderia steynii]
MAWDVMDYARVDRSERRKSAYFWLLPDDYPVTRCDQALQYIDDALGEQDHAIGYRSNVRKPPMVFSARRLARRDCDGLNWTCVLLLKT